MSKNRYHKNEEIFGKEVIDDQKEETIEDPIIGVVSGCQKLRVRAKADADSEVLTIIDAGAELQIIDGENASADFYKVTTEVGIDGFVMRQFVTIK